MITESMPLMAHKGVRIWIAALVLSALVFVLWDTTGLDVAVSSVFGDEQGFKLRNNWFLERVMHDAVRWLAWCALGILVWRALRSKDRALQSDARWAIAGILIALIAVQIMKRNSATSCPWDLQMFGGLADYVPHWILGLRDNGSGSCFPAGHPLVAFAFLPGWVALQHRVHRSHWILAGIIGAGLLLGLVQVARGAHFISHALWSGWICAMVAGVAGAARMRSKSQRLRYAKLR